MIRESSLSEGLFKTGQPSPIYMNENPIIDHLQGKVGRDEEDFKFQKILKTGSKIPKKDKKNPNTGCFLVGWIFNAIKVQNKCYG